MIIGKNSLVSTLTLIKQSQTLAAKSILAKGIQQPHPLLGAFGNVLVQNILPVKLLVTYSAVKEPRLRSESDKAMRIILLFEVSPFMIGPISCSGEPSAAVMTPVRFLSSMCPHMYIEIALLNECRIADGTINCVLDIQVERTDVEV